MTTPATIKQREGSRTLAFGASMPFEGIHERGAYVFNRSGYLLRVPDEACRMGCAHEVSMLANEPLFVTKVSEDPFVPISKARLLAGNCDLEVNF